MPTVTTTRQYTVTPWRTHSDLLQFRNNVLSNDINKQKDALSVLHIWKQRGNLPHAIESTGLILEATLFHQSFISSSLSSDASSYRIVAEDAFPVRATYTIALTRFVTGFADLGRQKAGPGRSMLDVAKSINLPAKFVEMRHEAAHEDMPSLPRLAMLAQEALRWLEVNFWNGLDQNVEKDRRENSLDEVEMRSRIKGVMKEFRSSRKSQVQEKREVDMFLVEDLVKKLVDYDISSIRRGTTLLVSVMCSPGMLIPAEADDLNLANRMSTAYLIWEKLLQVMANTLQRFMKAWLSYIIQTCSQVIRSTGHRGLLSWMLRIFSDEEWKTVLGNRHKSLLQWSIQQCLSTASTELKTTTLSLVERYCLVYPSDGSQLRDMYAAVYIT